MNPTQAIKQFFAPLGVFVLGMCFILAMWIVWPAADTSIVALSANTSSIASNYWGWSWLMSTGVVQYIAFAIAFLCVCFATGVTFLLNKPRF